MSLRAKLVGLISGLGIILIIVSTFFMFNYNKRILLEDTLENNNDIGLAISISLDNQLSELANTVSTLASIPCIREYIIDNDLQVDYGDQEALENRFKELNEKWASTNDIDDPFVKSYLTNSMSEYFKEQMDVIPDLYGEIFLTNKHGELLASTTKLTTFSHEDKGWWLAAYNEGKGRVHFDDRGYDESVGDFVLGVVAPVYDGNEVIGILKCNLKIFSLFDELVRDFVPLYEPGSVKIARTSGLVVLELNETPLSTQIDGDPQALLYKDGFSGIYKSKDEKETLISINHVKNTTPSGKYSFGGISQSIDHSMGNRGHDWAVVLTVPSQVVSQRIRRIMKQFIFASLISIIIIALLSFIFVKQVTKDIVGLVAFAERVGQGQLDTTIKVRTKDEIGVLAHAFNRMVGRLKSTMASKEELVKEIDKRKKIEEKLKRLSTTDDLTQLYNRRAFNDYIESYISHTRQQDEFLSVAMIDIDYFKDINDKYGHSVGDQVLTKLSEILLSSTRKADIVSRWGGEEFLILMPGIDREGACKVAERLRIKVEKTKFIKDICITISIGVSELNEDDSIDSLLKRVDDAQYMAKSRGRNKVKKL